MDVLFTTRAVNERCLNAHLAAECSHDMDGTLATLHPECVFVDMPLDMRFEGHEGASRHYSMWWSAFGNTIDPAGRNWVTDDLVVGEGSFVGRHVGPFVGVPASDRPIRMPFVAFVQFRDGLLAGERFMYDLNGLLRQIGWPAFTPGRTRRGDATTGTAASAGNPGASSPTPLGVRGA